MDGRDISLSHSRRSCCRHCDSRSNYGSPISNWTYSLVGCRSISEKTGHCFIGGKRSIPQPCRAREEREGRSCDALGGVGNIWRSVCRHVRPAFSTLGIGCVPRRYGDWRCTAHILGYTSDAALTGGARSAGRIEPGFRCPTQCRHLPQRGMPHCEYCCVAAGEPMGQQPTFHPKQLKVWTRLPEPRSALCSIAGLPRSTMIAASRVESGPDSYTYASMAGSSEACCRCCSALALQLSRRWR
jgi:hypothetical protein